MTSFAPLTGTTLKYQPTHNVNTGKYTSVGLEVDGRGELNSNDCSMTCKNQDKQCGGDASPDKLSIFEISENVPSDSWFAGAIDPIGGEQISTPSAIISNSNDLMATECNGLCNGEVTCSNWMVYEESGNKKCALFWKITKFVTSGTSIMGFSKKVVNVPSTTGKLIVTDLNGDGKADLICQNYATGSIDVKLLDKANPSGPVIDEFTLDEVVSNFCPLPH